jgi:hypothetical protein
MGMAVEARTISTASVSAQEDEKVWQSFTTVSSDILTSELLLPGR